MNLPNHAINFGVIAVYLMQVDNDDSPDPLDLQPS